MLCVCARVCVYVWLDFNCYLSTPTHTTFNTTILYEALTKGEIMTFFMQHLQKTPGILKPVYFTNLFMCRICLHTFILHSFPLWKDRKIWECWAFPYKKKITTISIVASVEQVVLVILIWFKSIRQHVEILLRNRWRHLFTRKRLKAETCPYLRTLKSTM